MRIFIVITALLFVFSGCKDEINIPGSTDIEDSAVPQMNIISPVPNQVFTGQTQIPLQVDFSDDFEVKSIDVQIYPRDNALDGMSFSKDIGAQTYSLDTTFAIPSTDSLVYDVLFIVYDNSNSPIDSSYIITSK